MSITGELEKRGKDYNKSKMLARRERGIQARSARTKEPIVSAADCVYCVANHPHARHVGYKEFMEIGNGEAES